MNDPFEAYSLSQRLQHLGAEYFIPELKAIGNKLVQLEQENAALRTELYTLKQGEVA